MADMDAMHDNCTRQTSSTESAGRSLTVGSGCHVDSVVIACCGQNARSALLQTQYGAGIGLEPAMAKCLQIMGVVSAA